MEIKQSNDALASLKKKTYDVVFVLGDLGENRAIIPEVLKTVASVRSRQGVFLVRGNHDCERGRGDLIAQLAREQSITVLTNTEQAVHELGISVVGLEYPWCGGPLPEPSKASFAVGLTHTPDNITHFDRLGVSLVLAGHTHGGKFRLPWIGPILVPSRYGRFLDVGWFQLRNTVMYITLGIGYFPGRLGRRGAVLELTIENRQ